MHEFLAPSTNTFTGVYGGSLENRIRFVVGEVATVADAMGAGMTTLRNTPEHNIRGVVESNR